MAALAAAYASDPLLLDMETLFRLGANSLPDGLPPADAAMFLEDTEAQLEPAARRVLGTAADVWLARQGRHAEVVENRRRLRDINGALFALYMQSR